MNLTNKQVKFIKGKLEVQALIDTRQGVTIECVPKDTIGYVCGHNMAAGKYLIFWPSLSGPIPGTNLRYNDSFRIASHPINDVKPTGKRG